MHKPVLLKESIEGLDLKAGEIFIDGTFGAGGHSKEVLRHFPTVKVIGLDRDPAVAKAMAGKPEDFDVRTMSFADIDELGIKADAILLDIGISSDQLDSVGLPAGRQGRGFSFQKEEPLDMRMSSAGLTAAEILNSWDEPAIELILRGFGEEKYSRRIAHEIVRRREMKPFETTSELVEAVSASVPMYYKRDRINPATRTFQALRIAVNEELTALEIGLPKAFEILNPSGRLAVISFHSLEDRIVKNFFRDKAKEGTAKLINKKPITPSEGEIATNPRSRSAKLRILEKL